MKVSQQELLILFDLSLSLKSREDFKPMLLKFIKDLAKKMNLISVSFEVNQEFAMMNRLEDHVISYPQKYRCELDIENRELLKLSSIVDFQESRRDDKFYYFYKILDLGLLKFEKKHKGLSEYVTRQLVVILEKLKYVSMSCFERSLLSESIEKAEKLSQAKSNFIAVMSHEMRTPLNGILGYTELLSLENLNKSHQEKLDKIYFSANTLLALINDILDFTKLDQSKVSLEKKSVDLNKVLRNVLDLVEKSYLVNENEYEVIVQKDFPQQILADQVKVSQVMFNLLSNAFKFTRDGKIIIKLLYEQPKVIFSVKDNGIGIPKDQISKLFNAFEQLDVSTTREYGGTGLGLAITDKIVKAMNGEITVNSEVGVGTEFVISFLGELSSQQENIPKQQVKNTVNDIQEKTVLLVEDNDLNREMLIKILKRIGVNVLSARNGQEGVEVYKSKQPDLVFMDLRMPVLDGIDASSEIIKFDKKALIIALTANSTKEDKEKCFEAGMVDYLTKPFKIKEIKEVLSKYLNHQK